MIREENSFAWLTAAAEKAFKQAASKMLARAKQTGTPVIVWQEGRVVEVPSDSFVLDSEKRSTSDITAFPPQPGQSSGK